MPNIFKYRRVVGAYKKMFLDGEGRLKPEARLVLDDLYDFSRLMKNVAPEPLTLALVEGSRSTVRHILSRAGTTAEEMARKTKEQISGDDHE